MLSDLPLATTFDIGKKVEQQQRASATTLDDIGFNKIDKQHLVTQNKILHEHL
ncbi:MAG: hypothetical protein ACI828_001937 [Flavobacteriales bacterium]|jgi:hypothetical protein